MKKSTKKIRLWLLCFAFLFLTACFDLGSVTGKSGKSSGGSGTASSGAPTTQPPNDPAPADPAPTYPGDPPVVTVNDSETLSSPQIQVQMLPGFVTISSTPMRSENYQVVFALKGE